MRYGTFALSILFQSTLSVRRATFLSILGDIPQIFQSTLSVRRATHDCVIFCLVYSISIHALRKESDRTAQCMTCPPSNFNPRSP